MPSPQGAPPYKRTRYDGAPPSYHNPAGQPPLPPGPAPPPPGLPPVGGQRGPPPPRGGYDRSNGPPPPPSMRGPPPPPPRGGYDDRYDGPPPPPLPNYRDDYRDRPPPPPAGPYDRGGYGAPPLPPSRGGYDDRRPLPPPSGRRGEDRGPPPRDLGPPPAPRGGGPRGGPSSYGPRDGPASSAAGSSRSGGGRGGGRLGGAGRPVSGLPSGRGGYASGPSSSRRGDRFAADANLPKGPRNARGGAGAGSMTHPKKERKWGVKESASGGKDKGSGDGKTLTDFRIAGLEIPELEWEWKGKLEAAVKAIVEEKENVTAQETTTTTTATAEVPKKKSKSQRKAERRRAAKAAKAAAEETSSVVADEDDDDEDEDVDGEAIVVAEEQTKKTKHGRDEDESRAGVDDDETKTKKVKADTGEVVRLENVGETDVDGVEVKDEETAEPEVKEETAEATPTTEDPPTATTEDVDGEPVEFKLESTDAVISVAADESVPTPTPAAPASSSNPPFKLSAANSAPPLNTPTGPPADRVAAPPANRENSRLRIYFSSPVDAVSTYVHSGGDGSVRGSTVEPRQPSVVRDTSMAPPSTEEKAAVAPATVVEEAIDGDGKAVEPSNEVAPATDVVEVEGDPADQPPLEGTLDGSEVQIDAPVEPDLVATAEVEGSTTTVAEEPVEGEETAAGDESMSSSYPPDPYAQGQPSIAGSTVAEDDATRDSSVAPSQQGGPPPLRHLTPPEPSADRISISYARNTRRMVLDAEIVDKVKIFRTEGRIELNVSLQPAMLGEGEDAVPDEFRVCQGILIEALDREHDDYIVIDRPSLEASWRAKPTVDESAIEGGESKEEQEQDAEETKFDPLLPPLHHLLAIATADENGVPSLSIAPGFTRDHLTVIAHFDRSNPLTEARWVKTGEIDQWILALAQEKKDDKPSAWKGKIVVSDPDPPPTIQNALDAWASSSSVGSLSDRQAFVSGHMSDIDNVLEILLRLTRGETRSSHHNVSPSSSSLQSPSVPILAASLSAPYPDSQTQVSLAVLAMFRLSVQTAEKAGLDTQEVHRQVSEIVRGVPHHLQFKALDGMFLEHRKKIKVGAATVAVPPSSTSEAKAVTTAKK